MCCWTPSFSSAIVACGFASGNAAKHSDPWQTVQGKSAHIEAKIIDRTSIVSKVEYALDSKDEWQAVNASDTIFDSPEEAVNFTIDGLAAGAHQIMLRASDAHNNPAYETVTITVEGK